MSKHNDRSDPANNSNQVRQKSLKYDYSELEKFLEKEYPEKECLAEHFFEFCATYMKMSTILLYVESTEIQHPPMPVIPSGSADWVQSFMEIFLILGRLPGGTFEIPEDLSTGYDKLPDPNEAFKDMVRKNRFHKAYFELVKDLPDHIDNLITIFEEFKSSNPEIKTCEGFPSEEETYAKLLEFLERCVQYRYKLWPTDE